MRVGSFPNFPRKAAPGLGQYTCERQKEIAMKKTSNSEPGIFRAGASLAKRNAAFGSLAVAALILAAALALGATPHSRIDAPEIPGGSASHVLPNATPPPIGFTVNSTSDGADAINNGVCETAPGNGVCTLRAAIQEANTHPGVTINFNIPTTDPGYSDGTWTITLSTALPDVSASVTISGPGADTLVVERPSNDGTANFRIFNITTTGTVTFSGLLIGQPLFASGAYVNGDGGGIQNASTGTVNVTNCTIALNVANNGGGIANESTGRINITNCSIVYNTAIVNGGGIYSPSGSVTITNSLVEFNSCGNNNSGPAFGGGVFNNGTLTIVNSTVYSNQAFSQPSEQHGGGIYNGVTASMTNSTVAGNIAFNGAGVENQGTFQVKSSIIAGDEGGSSNNLDVLGPFVSSGFNFIGAIDGSTGFTAATDQTGTAASPLDPRFEYPQDNGGPTWTMELICGSPAIDKGSSNGLTGNLTTDQRGTGFARTVDDSSIPNPSGGDGTDVGAFEFGASPVLPVSVVSRKFHGGGSSPPFFDIPLPLSCGSIGVECRRNTGGDTSGPNVGHDHELIVTFGGPVTVGGVSVVSTSNDLNSITATFTVINQVVAVDLHNVPNGRRLTINLRQVSDGTNTGFVSIPMGVLLGDVNASGRVDAADVSLVRQQTLQTITTSNFREDINVSGRIDAADVSIARQQTLSSLP